VAKFRLLEHGLLDAAMSVDDIRLQTRRKQGDQGDEEEVKGETVKGFQERVNLFVMVHLCRASGSKRDHYKDVLVYQARKDLILEFLKATASKQCKNDGCRA
jgi:hypothetical protein